MVALPRRPGAPSYFIEGMLYYEPNDKHGTSYEDTVGELNQLGRRSGSDEVCLRKRTLLADPGPAKSASPAAELSDWGVVMLGTSSARADSYLC
jgi:hypothetical protein